MGKYTKPSAGHRSRGFGGEIGVVIARYSNYMDIDSLDHMESLPENEIQRRLAVTREILQKAGAHYVIDTFDQLPDVIEDVNLRLERGETP